MGRWVSGRWVGESVVGWSVVGGFNKTWNIPKGQRVYTTVKPLPDLVFEKSVYTKPKYKLVILANDKKEYLDFSPAVTNQQKLKDKENLRNILIHFWKRIFLHLVLFY